MATKKGRTVSVVALATGSRAVPVGKLFSQLRDWKRRAKNMEGYEAHYRKIHAYNHAEECKLIRRMLETCSDDIRLLTARPTKRQPRSNVEMSHANPKNP